MKVLKTILLIIVALIVLFLIVAAFMPSKYYVERSIDVNKPVELVFEHVVDLNHFEQWSPWYKSEPSAYLGVEGQGVGQVSRWDGDTVGKGSLTVTKILENELVEQMLIFEAPMAGEADVKFTFTENEDASVKVSWITEGKLGYPIARFFKSMIETDLVKSFDEGLLALKERVEAIEGTYYKVTITEFPAGKYYTVAEKAQVNEIKNKMEIAMGELYNFLNANSIQPQGYPMAMTVEYNEEAKYWDFIAAIPVTDNSLTPTGRIKTYEMPATKALMVKYVGSYDMMEPAYRAIENYAKKHNLEFSGMPIEQYVNSPMDTPTSELVTNIFFPIK